MSSLALESPKTRFTDTELEVIQYFVNKAQLFGLPKSLGEIYAVIYLSPAPLCMEDIIYRLEISLGTASQGLRQLRKLKAVQVSHISGDRRDFYTAETELRTLIGQFLSEVIMPELEEGRQRLQGLQSNLPNKEPLERKHLEKRLAKLRQWNSVGSKLIPRIAKWIRI